jgi:hypothetical protein
MSLCGKLEFMRIQIVAGEKEDKLAIGLSHNSQTLTQTNPAHSAHEPGLPVVA